MEPVHELSRPRARRIAVRAQLLALPRPTETLQVVRHLGLLQPDPTAAVAPSAELVLWSRIGSALPRHALDDAMAEGSLVVIRGMVRPAERIDLYRAEMAAWPGQEEWRQRQAQWLEANEDCRGDILEKLDEEGPLLARDLPDTTLVAWRSSGWNDDRNVRMMLELMDARGDVAVAGFAGRERLWDLAERVYPDGPTVPLEQARRERARLRLQALGLARARAASTPGEPDDVGQAGEPAVVEGVRGSWRVDPGYLDDELDGRVALLSPLDRLVFDRKRMTELFGFDYQLEMYKPREQRRWGYWALPVLAGEDLVGKVDAAADYDRGLLLVHAVHEDHTWRASTRDAVHDELADLADWLGLELQLQR